MEAGPSRRAQSGHDPEPCEETGEGKERESRGTRYSSHEAPKRELVTKMAELHGEGHFGGKGQPIP